MKLQLDCYPCALKQAIQTAHLLHLDDGQTQIILDQCMKLLLARAAETTPLHITTRLYSFIHRTFFPKLDSFDPYKEIKDKTNRTALSCYPALEKLMADSVSPPETALKIAAAGNIIDFGISDLKHVDIEEEIRSINNLNLFGILKQPIRTSQ